MLVDVRTVEEELKVERRLAMSGYRLGYTHKNGVVLNRISRNFITVYTPDVV